jgi:hypothetical protein
MPQDGITGGATVSSNQDFTKYLAAPPSSPLLRMEIIRNYAKAVFGKALLASAWLGRPNGAVLGGVGNVATACQSAQGFHDAMRELIRLQASKHTSDGPAWPPAVTANKQPARTFPPATDDPEAP